MPDRYLPYQTCHRRFQEWVESGTFEGILRSLITNFKERDELDLTECFIDVESTLDELLVDETPQRLIGDEAYDSDPLDERLLDERNLELIAPHKCNRRKPKTQDGRKLRRYKRRWKIERLFAWLQNYRCILVRFDYKLVNYQVFVHLGAIYLILRRYF